MTPYEFWLAAASWGSYMTSSDPGACMYGFNERGVVQSEEHRQDCIAYLEGPCRQAANINIAAGEYLDGHAEIDALVAYLKTAKIG